MRSGKRVPIVATLVLLVCAFALAMHDPGERLDLGTSDTVAMPRASSSDEQMAEQGGDVPTSEQEMNDLRRLFGDGRRSADRGQGATLTMEQEMKDLRATSWSIQRHGVQVLYRRGLERPTAHD